MVFGMVLLAALASTTANYLSLRTYVDWKSDNSNCAERTQLAKLGLNRAAESALKEMARGVQAEVKNNYLFDVSVGAEGRTLSYTYRFKRPWPIRERFVNGCLDTKRPCSMVTARMTRTLF